MVCVYGLISKKFRDLQINIYFLPGLSSAASLRMFSCRNLGTLIDKLCTKTKPNRDLSMGVSRGCRFNVSANSPFESFDELLVIERCYRLKFVGKEIFS